MGACVAFALGTAFIHSASGAPVTLDGSDAFGQTSFNTGVNWDDNSAPSPGNDYFTSNFLLRTPTGGSNHTFAGDTLSIDPGGNFGFKSNGNITVDNLILNGGTISHFSVGGNQQADLFGTVNVAANSQLRATGSNTRRLQINSTVTGSANLEIVTDTDNRVEFFGNMAGYSGDIIVNGRADIFNGSLGSGTVMVNGLLRSDNTTSANGYLAGTIAGDVQVNDGGQAFIRIPTATNGGGPYVVTQQFTIDGDAANSPDNSQIHYDPAGATVGPTRRVDLTNVRLASNAVAGIRNNEGNGGNVGLTLLGNATITADGEADIFDLLGVTSSGGSRTLTVGQTETFNTTLLGVSDAGTTLTLANANLGMDPVADGSDINGAVNVNSGSSMTVSSDWVFDGTAINVNSGGMFTGESVTVDGATFDVAGGTADIQSFNLINGAQGGASNGGTLNVLGNTTTVNGGSTLFITGSSNFNEAMDLVVGDGVGETGFVDQNTGGNADIDGGVIIGRDGGVGDWAAAPGSGTVSIGSGAGSIFDIGRTNVAGVSGTSGDVDLSGASGVAIDVSELRIGTLPGSANPGSNALGVLTLSDTGTNTIDASTQVIVGDSPGSGNVGGHQLNFGGAANNVNTPLLTIAGRKSSASASIDAGGTLNLNGAGGAGRAELRIGYNNAGTGSNVTGIMDLSGGTFNANISTLAIGRHGSGSGSGSGTLTFEAGTVDANNVILGEASAGSVDGSSNPQNTVGNIVQNGGDFIVNGSMTLGLNGASGNFTANGGTVSVGNGGGDNLFVGRRDQNAGGINAAVVSTMDLSGASQFTFDGNQIGVGTVVGGGSGQTRPGGTLLLANTNNIAANSILIADSPSVGLGGHTNLVELGNANTISAGAITVGGSKGTALLNFRNPGSTLNLNSAGSRGDLFIGNQVVGTGGGSNGTVNFLDSTVTAFLDELVVARKPNSATGNTNGTLSFNNGTIDVNSVQLGVRTNAGSAGSVTGTINQSGGTMIVNGNMQLGVDGGTGNLNLSGGAVTALDVNLGVGSGMSMGTLTQTGGTLNVTDPDTYQVGAGGLGTVVHSGGAANVTGNLNVGTDGTAGDSYTLSNTGVLDFGDTATGTQQTAGLTQSTLTVGPDGAFNFTGGTLQNVRFIDVDASNSPFTVGDNDPADTARFVIGADGADPNDPNTVRAYTTIQENNSGSTPIDFVLNSDGTLAVDIFGSASHGVNGEQGGTLMIDPLDPDLDSDILEVTGTATLDGTLDVALNGFEPYPFAWYDVLVADEITLGDDFDVLGVNLARVVDDPFDPTRQILQVAVPEPASIALWSLLGLAFAALGFARLRRQRQAAA